MRQIFDQGESLGLFLPFSGPVGLNAEGLESAGLNTEEAEEAEANIEDMSGEFTPGRLE